MRAKKPLGKQISLSPRAAVTLLLAATAPVLTACAQVPIEEAIPGAIDTGTYPNLNEPAKAATSQLTDSEARAEQAQLERLQAGNLAAGRRDGNSKAELMRLQRLRAQHAKDALRQIEGK